MPNSVESLMIMMVVPGGYDDDDDDEPYIDDIWLIKNIYKMASICLCLKNWAECWFWLASYYLLVLVSVVTEVENGDGEDLNAAAY